MYSEKTFKNYIFWTQVKRVVVIIILSCLGAAIGILIGKILESALKLTSYNNLIIGVSTTIFFFLGVLFTVGTGREVQDGYWKIAVLRKLTVIQKNLELNNELLRTNGNNMKDIVYSPEYTEKNTPEEEMKKDETKTTAIYKYDETALVPQTKNKGCLSKKKKLKKVKK